MYNVHEHNKNTLKAMCCRYSLAFVTWSDTQEASLSSQSLCHISPDSAADTAIVWSV